MLDHPNPVVQEEAVRAVGELEIKHASPQLLEMLPYAEPELRPILIWSLSMIGGRGVADQFSLMLDETEDDDEMILLEEALDNLAFNEGLDDFALLDFTEEDLEDSIHEVDQEDF